MCQDDDFGFASKVRQNGQKPNTEDEGAEVKYMINFDSHEADWLLWHTARLHIFFSLVFLYSLLVIVKQR